MVINEIDDSRLNPTALDTTTIRVKAVVLKWLANKNGSLTLAIKAAKLNDMKARYHKAMATRLTKSVRKLPRGLIAKCERLLCKVKRDLRAEVKNIRRKNGRIYFEFKGFTWETTEPRNFKIRGKRSKDWALKQVLNYIAMPSI
jgi:hypothetical protein